MSKMMGLEVQLLVRSLTLVVVVAEQAKALIVHSCFGEVSREVWPGIELMLWLGAGRLDRGGGRLERVEMTVSIGRRALI